MDLTKVSHNRKRLLRAKRVNKITNGNEPNDVAQLVRVS